MRFSIVLALAATIVSPAVAKEKKPADPDKPVCRTDVPTGSVFKRRVCHTRQVWAVIDGTEATSRDGLRDHRNDTVFPTAR